jgi:hypothetical protein
VPDVGEVVLDQETMKKCGVVRLQHAAGSLCANGGMRLPKSH